MRLINAENHQLETFPESSGVEFAILSHTWWADADEVTFQDFPLSLEDGSTEKFRRGFEKVQMTCELARRKGYHYMWIDMCCIDKSSSAELSEAINSMFRWYRDATVCFVYLSDFVPLGVSIPDYHRNTVLAERLASCRWFTRGWTLQELVAPRHMEFYDSDWNYIGNKSSLVEQLSNITFIGVDVLQDSRVLHLLPVACRMSWASRRQTTRPEDMSYCLFGIFDVNMPLLYGEGARKAFHRLQEHMASQYNDPSLFAWQTESGESEYSGIFATHPADFKNRSGLTGPVGGFRAGSRRMRFGITNHGVQVEGWAYGNLLALDCHDLQGSINLNSKWEDRCWLGIMLLYMNGDFVRGCPNQVYRVKPRPETQPDAKRASFLIRKDISHTMVRMMADVQKSYIFVSVDKLDNSESVVSTRDILPVFNMPHATIHEHQNWPVQHGLTTEPPLYTVTGALPGDIGVFILPCGSMRQHNIFVLVGLQWKEGVGCDLWAALHLDGCSLSSQLSSGELSTASLASSVLSEDFCVDNIGNVIQCKVSTKVSLQNTVVAHLDKREVVLPARMGQASIEGRAFWLRVRFSVKDSMGIHAVEGC